MLSGQPALGVGEIAHGMRAALNGAHQVGVAAHNARQLGGKIVNGVRGTAQNIASAGSTINSAFKSGQAAKNARAAELRGQTKWGSLDAEGKQFAEQSIEKDSAGAGRSAFFRSLASAAGQKAKQGLYKAATGRDMQFFDETGKKDDSKKALTVGQKFFDKTNQVERVATLEDVRKNNNARMEEEQKKALAKRKSAVQFGNDLEDKLHHKTSI